MLLIAREIFFDSKTDEDLRALNAIEFFEADVNSVNELINLFEKENPNHE